MMTTPRALDSFELLLAPFSCVICSRLCLPSLRQCPNGHLTCQECRMRVDKCALCREPHTHHRNLLGDSVLRVLNPPSSCVWSGCNTEAQELSVIESHLPICPQRPVKCPRLDCSKRVSKADLTEHFKKTHIHHLVRSSGTFRHVINMQDPEREAPYIYEVHNRTFFDGLGVCEGSIYFYIGILGEEYEENDYICTIKVVSLRRDLAWIMRSKRALRIPVEIANSNLVDRVTLKIDIRKVMLP